MMHSSILTCHKSCSQSNKAHMKLPLASSTNLRMPIIPTTEDNARFLLKIAITLRSPQQFQKRIAQTIYSRLKINVQVGTAGRKLTQTCFKSIVMNLRFQKTMNNDNHLLFIIYLINQLMFLAPEDLKRNDKWLSMRFNNYLWWLI